MGSLATLPLFMCILFGLQVCLYVMGKIFNVPDIVIKVVTGILFVAIGDRINVRFEKLKVTRPLTQEARALLFKLRVMSFMPLAFTIGLIFSMVSDDQY